MRGAQANPHSVCESAYDAFGQTSPKYKDKAEYDDRATWAIHVACFHHSCFVKGVWRRLSEDVVIGNTPLFFSAQGSVVNDSAVKEAKE